MRTTQNVFQIIKTSTSFDYDGYFSSSSHQYRQWKSQCIYSVQSAGDTAISWTWIHRRGTKHSVNILKSLFLRYSSKVPSLSIISCTVFEAALISIH